LTPPPPLCYRVLVPKTENDMAGADYKNCTLCGRKAFYDANLNYVFGEDSDLPPYREAGKPQYEDPELNKKHGAQLDRVGDWAVLCHDCAKTHKTIIVPIEK
jgi:hypothetical protein